MAKIKKGILRLLLIGIIIILGIFSYLFLIRPAVSGLVIQGQNQGVQYAVLTIMQQAATCNQVPLTFGNVTMNLIAVDCLKPVK